MSRLAHSRAALPSAMSHGVAVVLTVIAIAAMGPTADAQQFYGDATYYGDNGWAGSCAGNIGGPWFPGTWPPAGSYISSLQPGSSTPVNVALNGPQYSTAMCGKLLYVKATGENAGCKTCGMNPIPDQYMLARVTNVCPECHYGSLDFGVHGDGRWKITWHWADSGTVTESVGTVSRSKVTKKVHNHTAKYWAKLKAAKLRSAARRAAKKIAAAKRAAAIYAAIHGRKLLAEELPAASQELPASA